MAESPRPETQNQIRVLVVEDDPILSQVLSENLLAEGYAPDNVHNGEDAWARLIAQPERYSLVLLDRRMPGVDGLEVLRRIKSDPDLTYLPVVMQTAMTEPEDILAGLNAGAHYYLTKPFTAETLLAIVRTAVRDFQHAQALRREVGLSTQTLRHLARAEFRYRTPEEARDIATLLSHACPDARQAALGLFELMLNAVEHGNLGITYGEKSRLIDLSELQVEIRRRLLHPNYAQRWARVEMTRTGQDIQFLISDEGEGFDWRRYLRIDPERAFDNHGRGIAMAAMLSFQRLEYQGRGNQVLAVVAAGH